VGGSELFTANTVAVSDDDYCWTVGLADHPSEPQHYLLVQRSKQHDQQDEELGMKNMYYEFDDQGRGFYGGVHQLRLGRNSLDLFLAPDVAKKHQMEPELHIPLALADAEWQNLRDGLRSIAAPFVALNEI
jgi:hypothetical protein